MTVLGRTTASALKGATESHRYLQRTIRKGAVYRLLHPGVVKTTDAPSKQRHNNAKCMLLQGCKTGSGRKMPHLALHSWLLHAAYTQMHNVAPTSCHGPAAPS